jgi:transglutaminase-like putative cysteine protease
LYNQIYACVMAYERNVPVDIEIKSDRVLAVWRAVRYDNPELFWLENSFVYHFDNDGFVTRIELEFTAEPREIPALREGFDARADAVLSRAKQLEHDGEKVRFIYDVLAAYVEYDLTMLNDQSAYGAIVENKAVCAGYAMAFTYFMQRLGIPTATLIGYAGGENHAWNLVNLGGIHYNMDVTWDSGSSSPTGGITFEWFVLSDNDFRTHVRDVQCRDFPRATGTTRTLKTFMERLPVDIENIW